MGNVPFRHRVVASVAVTALLIASAVTAADEGAWPPGPDSGFRADVYPSIRWAVRALGRDAADAAAGAKAGSVVVYVPADGADAWDDAIDVLRAQTVGAEVTQRTGVLPDSERPATGELWIGFSTGDIVRSRVRWSGAEVTEGLLAARVVTGTEVTTLTARFDEKPWAADAARFLDGDNERAWVVGRCDRPCADRAEAERLALADAAQCLMERAGPGGRESRGHLRRSATAALNRGDVVADRLTRRFDRPYGRVWDAAVLVDASPEMLRALSHDARATQDAQRAKTLTASAAAGGFAVVVVVLYGVVNALTKGYFVWRLRAAAAALLVLTGLGMLMLLV